ncbi:MAG: SdiA-regulated domain-containing protein [Chloroflexi bacterium]|nr:SdiA-regulated domain-containing protein [Chloroflexota bacterium]MCC6895261.1 hypothetical protein [Anaerolineae bacterium]
MRRWVLLICILGTLLGSTQVLAQDAERFFGLRDDTLISFTLDGNTTELLGSINPEAVRLLKTDSPEHPLLIAEVDGTFRLFLVGPIQKPQPILLPEGYIIEDMNWVIFSRHHPYYVLQSSLRLPESIGLLVNVDALVAQPLSGHLFFTNQETAKFSADGTKLRYPSNTTEGQNTWYLIERDLASGEEHRFYSVDDYYPPFTSDSEGGRWLLRRVDRTTKIATTELIKPDGTITTYATEDSSTPQLRLLWNDLLYVTPALCQTDCPIKIAPIEDGDAGAELTFTVPEVESLAVPLTMPDSERLVITDNSGYWLLKTDDTATYLGIHNPAIIYNPRVLSDDGRWLMSITNDEDGEPVRYQVWDLTSERTVIERDIPRGLNVSYDDEGIIVWEYTNTQLVYRFSDGQLFTLEIGNRETLFALAAPQIGLVSVGNESKIGEQGIYAYDLEAQTYQLLAADTRPLVAY